MAEAFVTGPGIIPYLTKDPDAILDYAFDWSDWLGADTIASHALTINGGSIVTHSASTTTVTVWVSGGKPGARITIKCQITTAGGRTDDRTLQLRVLER